MDKYENKVKIDEIKALISEGAYEDAADIADTVDWSSVKNVSTIGMASDLYKALRRFEESRNVLTFAYEKQQSRPIVRSMCELSIEMGDLMNAIEYYREFKEIAPKDPGRLILQYKIFKSQGISLEEQIEVLEALKEEEHIAKWEYELATLYHRAGMASKCVSECDEIILWVVDGKYVLKAYELKAQHQPLTERENYQYEVLRQAGGSLNIQYSLREDAPKETEKKEFAIGQDVSPFNTQNLQAVVAEGLQDVLNPDAVPALQEVPETIEEARALDERANAIEEASAPTDTEANLYVTQLYNPLMPEAPVGQELEENTSPIDADSVRHSDTDILGDVTTIMAADILQGLDDEDDGDVEPEIRLQQNTDEIRLITGEIPQVDFSKSITSDTGVIETFHRGSSFDDMLTQGYDGQISLVLPENQIVEKQITGQLSIDDVMKEWERKKKENEDKLVADVKARIHGQAASLLADFDEATKSSLLGQIESAMVNAALKEEHDRIAASRPKEIKVSDIEKADAAKAAAAVAAKEAAKEAAKAPIKAAEAVMEAAPEIKEAEAAKVEEPKAEEKVAEKKPEPKEEAVEPVKEEMETAEDPGVEEIEEIEEIKDTDAEEDIEETQDAEEIEEDEEDFDEELDDDEFEDEESEDDDYEDDYEDEDDYEEEEEVVEHTSSPRDLSDTEYDTFRAFVPHRKAQQQLAEVLDNVTLASCTGNVLVSSDEDSEVTTFSKLLIQEIQQTDSNFTGKVAMISGDSLNRRDIPEALEKVKNGALIIGEPELLKKKTVEALIHELNKDGFGLVVIMQGHADVLDKIVAQNKGMMEAFNLRVDLEAFDDKTLVEYAHNYAYDQGYSIDEMGELALHRRVNDMQTAEHEVTLAEIEDMVEDAIYYAERKTPKNLLGAMFGKKYDDDRLVVLHEKDFMHY